jgi:hypothetical protein
VTIQAVGIEAILASQKSVGDTLARVNQGLVNLAIQYPDASMDLFLLQQDITDAEQTLKAVSSGLKLGIDRKPDSKTGVGECQERESATDRQRVD